MRRCCTLHTYLFVYWQFMSSQEYVTDALFSKRLIILRTPFVISRTSQIAWDFFSLVFSGPIPVLIFIKNNLNNHKIYMYMSAFF